MNFPHHIQKAVDLGLLDAADGKIVAVQEDMAMTIFQVARITEKLQPTTAAKLDDTTNQEAIVLTRVLSSQSGKARHLWSELRSAFGVGYGDAVPDQLWSSKVFRRIGRNIDRIFVGEADFETISAQSIISMHANSTESSVFNGVPMSEYSKTVSKLSEAETMSAYGAEESEWKTAIDILRQARVKAQYELMLHHSSQASRADSKLEKNLQYLQEESMRALSMMRGSISQEGNFRSLTSDLIGDEGHEGFLDRILNVNAGIKPASTGILALDIDMQGGVRPPGVGGGRVFVLGARTGVGKTQIGVQALTGVALDGYTVGMISAELDRDSIYARIWASVSAQTAETQDEVLYSETVLSPPERMKEQVAWNLQLAMQRLDETGGKILVEAPWAADVQAVVSTMRSMKAKNPELRLVVLDHFHCLSRHKGAPQNEASMLEERSYALTSAAKELDLDMIVLAQMNRVGMDALSAKQPPQLDQIRGSDALSHIASAVWIARSQMQDDGAGGTTSTGNMELWHVKLRSGESYWDERKGELVSVLPGKSLLYKCSVIRMNYATSSIYPGPEGDDTFSKIR